MPKQRLAYNTAPTPSHRLAYNTAGRSPTPSHRALYPNLVELVVDFVEDEGSVVVGSVPLHHVMDCRRGRGAGLVGKWAGSSAETQGLTVGGVEDVDNLHPVKVDHDSSASATRDVLHLVCLQGGLKEEDTQKHDSEQTSRGIPLRATTNSPELNHLTCCRLGLGPYQTTSYRTGTIPHQW